MLIIGGSGLLGQRLVDYFDKKYSVVGTYHNRHPDVASTFVHMNITNKENILSCFEDICPDIVVLSAAFTNVDKCEIEKKMAYKVNVAGIKDVCKQIEKYNAKCVYVSTDYVFDGKKGNYVETDSVNPINFYGETKKEAEDIVSFICSDFLILRPSVIFGIEKPNFVTWVIDSLKKKQQINIVTDQFVSPTLNVDFGLQLDALLRADQQGVFHCSGGERINRFDFSCEIADVFNLEKQLINPISMDDLNWMAKRPIDSSLNVTKISDFQKPMPVRKALMVLKKEISK